MTEARRKMTRDCRTPFIRNVQKGGIHGDRKWVRGGQGLGGGAVRGMTGRGFFLRCGKRSNIDCGDNGCGPL